MQHQRGIITPNGLHLLVEAQDRILPMYDEELSKPVAASLHKLGVQVQLGSGVQGPRLEMGAKSGRRGRYDPRAA